MTLNAIDRARRLARDRPGALAVCIVAAATFLFRWPLRFDWFGEHDQARFLVDSILYRYEGADIFRKYFIHTSPASLWFFATVDRLFGHASLLPLGNALAVVAVTATAVAVYAYAAPLTRSALWAASIAIAATFVPGVFVTSFYGYPSVYSLPFMVTAAVLCLHAVRRSNPGRARLLLGCSALAYVTGVLIKVDFALAGTWLVAIVIENGARSRRLEWVVRLGFVAVIAMLVALAIPTMMIGEATAPRVFGTEWVEGMRVYRQGLFDGPSIVNATGIGTFVLLVVASIAVGLRFGRQSSGRGLAAWAVAVMPLWLFWAFIPPLSTRHCIPGALITAVYTGVALARVLPARRIVAVVWPVVLIAANWGWNKPAFDINYGLSGNLWAQYRVNRNAFEACRRIVDEVVAVDKPVNVVVGQTAFPSVLDAIDVLPMIRYELAVPAVDVRNQDHPLLHYNLHTKRADGSERIFFDARYKAPGLLLARTAYEPADYFFYSLSVPSAPDLARHGIEVRKYDLKAVYDAVVRNE